MEIFNSEKPYKFYLMNVNIHVTEIQFVGEVMDQSQLSVMKVNHGYYFETVVESNTNF